MPLYPGGATLPAPLTGHYFFPASPNTTASTAAHGNGSLKLVPWILSRTARFTQIGAEVTIVGEAGSKVRLGIYADTGNSYPGALVVDAGQIAGDSATVQELAIDVTLAAGVYWVGGVVQSAPTTQPTVRTCSTSWSPPVALPSSTSAPAGNSTGIGVSLSAVTAALPATFTAGSVSNPTILRVFLKAA